jgi:hypothetical protein
MSRGTIGLCIAVARTGKPKLEKRYIVGAVERLRQRISLTLQLPFPQVSESMGNHDSKIVDAGSVN